MQQVSTFAINYQGRPFRESLSENKMMFYGIVGVSGLAFVCAAEIMPEINESIKLVPFTNEFKTKMTICMALDFVVCWTIEVVLKYLFSDYYTRDIAVRRPEQLAREEARKKIEAEKKAAEDDAARLAQVAEFERKVAERRRALEERWGVRPAGQPQAAAAAGASN